MPYGLKVIIGCLHSGNMGSGERASVVTRIRSSDFRTGQGTSWLKLERLGFPLAMQRVFFVCCVSI